MATERSGSRARNGARDAILAMLKDDHERVKKAFKDFEKLKDKEDGKPRRELVERTCNELEVHAELEEQVFYPAVRDGLDEPALIEEAKVEHTSAKALIAQLKITPPDDPKYAATFTVLSEYVKHHIQEEEGELFPQLREVELDWDGLRDRMHERRDTLAKVYLTAPGSGRSAAEKRPSAS